MALPDQIKRQSEAIQKLYTDVTDADGGDAAAAAAASAAAADGVVPVPPVTVIEPPKSGDPAAEDFEQKYKSLQGMYNADVPKLHSQLREQQSRISQMESLMASLNTVVPVASPTAQALVSTKDVEEYGESIDVMRKVSREELHPVFAKLATLETALNNLATSMNTSILPQVQQVVHSQAVSAEGRFWQDLERSLPNWQQINNDPGFQTWLLTVDPLMGSTRQAHLDQAQKALDVNRVLAFFQTWTTATGKYAASAAPIKPAQPRGSASELEAQLAPGRSRGSSPPVNPNAKTYSPADITKFYDDVRKGLYKGREAERNQIEVDIFSARNEGRIVANAYQGA